MDEINDLRLRDGLWNVVYVYFKKKRRQKALDAAERIVGLYTKPIVDIYYFGIPQQSADHYRTRSELVRTCKDPAVVDMMIDYGLLELHPKWPFKKRDHPETPYRPVLRRFEDVRVNID